MKCIKNCGTDAAIKNQYRQGITVQTLPYHGYCTNCWLALTPEERGILLGEPPERLTVYKERISPATPTWKKAVTLIWQIVITGIAVHLLLRK